MNIRVIKVTRGLLKGLGLLGLLGGVIRVAVLPKSNWNRLYVALRSAASNTITSFLSPVAPKHTQVIHVNTLEQGDEMMGTHSY